MLVKKARALRNKVRQLEVQCNTLEIKHERLSKTRSSRPDIVRGSQTERAQPKRVYLSNLTYRPVEQEEPVSAANIRKRKDMAMKVASKLEQTHTYAQSAHPNRVRRSPRYRTRAYAAQLASLETPRSPSQRNQTAPSRAEILPPHQPPNVRINGGDSVG
jgi:hypothetical protein